MRARGKRFFRLEILNRLCWATSAEASMSMMKLKVLRKIVDSGLMAVVRAKSSEQAARSRKLALKAASRRLRLPSQFPARLTSSATSSSDSPPTESS